MASLLALSRAEQEVAKKWFVTSRLAHVITLLLTIPTLFVSEGIAYFLAFVPLASEVVAWLLRFFADRRHSLAEEGRRRALLADALNKADEQLALRDLRTKFSTRSEKLAPRFEDANYYASAAPAGNERLRAHMQESAYWSRDLYGVAGRWTLAAAIGLFALVVAALLAVIGVGSDNTTLQVARIGVLFLSFLVFSDVLTQALAWLDASAKSDGVYRRLESGPLDDPAAALAVFSDYSVATATTPPIPSFIYRLRKEHIERGWASAS
jgi:uncharacterized membrane protein YbhN (UPF0104 family)